MDLRYWIGNLIAVAALLVFGMIAGCEKVEPAVLPVKLEGSGIVRGKVLFVGTPPVMEPIANEPCHEEAGPLLEETVVVKDGALKNVFVYLKNAPATDGTGVIPAMLDQVHCQYVPHAIGVQTNQSLRVRSSDPTLHNVHYDPRANPPENFGLVKPGSEKVVSFKTAEFVRVKCDVHPWMTAYVGVFANPFFAVTGDDGSFEIKGVPDGSYNLAIWHERLGEQEKEITLSAGRPVELSFEYKAPE